MCDECLDIPDEQILLRIVRNNDCKYPLFSFHVSLSSLKPARHDEPFQQPTFIHIIIGVDKMTGEQHIYL